MPGNPRVPPLVLQAAVCYLEERGMATPHRCSPVHCPIHCMITLLQRACGRDQHPTYRSGYARSYRVQATCCLMVQTARCIQMLAQSSEETHGAHRSCRENPGELSPLTVDAADSLLTGDDTSQVESTKPRISTERSSSRLQVAARTGSIVHAESSRRIYPALVQGTCGTASSAMCTTVASAAAPHSKHA